MPTTLQARTLIGIAWQGYGPELALELLNAAERVATERGGTRVTQFDVMAALEALEAASG
jgi:hypothetical protein